MNLASNLANFRKEKGITQKTLGDSVGVCANAISNYEIGIREPNIETLKKIATTLEVTVDELLKEAQDDERAVGSKTP